MQYLKQYLNLIGFSFLFGKLCRQGRNLPHYAIVILAIKMLLLSVRSILSSQCRVEIIDRHIRYNQQLFLDIKWAFTIIDLLLLFQKLFLMYSCTRYLVMLLISHNMASPCLPLSLV